MKEAPLFTSHYFKFWYDHIELTSKPNVISTLKKFNTFLILQGFEDDLDFDQFHGSRKLPGSFIPIQESFIDKFVEYLKTDCNTSCSALYNTISMLKNFFGFLYEMELIKHHPMEDYPIPYYQHPIKNTALSKEECLALLKAAIKKDPFFRQDFVLIWFMLVTGIRNSEVRFLPYQNVNLNTRMILLDNRQKGEVRSTSITEALRDELRRYMGHPTFKSWINKGNNTLFFHNNRPLSRYLLQKRIKNLCADAGINRNVTPHDLRRTAGYLMQSSGMHIVEIQRQLGHKNLASTLRYVPPLEELAEILLRLE